ncbi:8068_t:CDS:1, partial [Funneliformis geosporum]
WDLFADKSDLILKTDPKFKNCTTQDLSTSQNVLNTAWDFFTKT